MGGQSFSIPEHFRHGPHASHAVRAFNAQNAQAIQALMDNFRAQQEYSFTTDPVFQDGTKTHLADLLVTERTGATTIDTVIQVESGPFHSNDVWNACQYFSSQKMNYLLVLVAYDEAINAKGHYFRPQLRKASSQTVCTVAGNEALAYAAFKRNVYFQPSTGSFAVVQFADYHERTQQDICAPNGRVIIQRGAWRHFRTKKIPVIESQPRRFVLDYSLVSHRGQTLRIARPLLVDAQLSFDKLLELEGRAAASEHGELSERVAISLANKVSGLDAQERERAQQKYGNVLKGLF